MEINLKKEQVNISETTNEWVDNDNWELYHSEEDHQEINHVLLSCQFENKLTLDKGKVKREDK